jgi:hypothetical protein
LVYEGRLGLPSYIRTLPSGVLDILLFLGMFYTLIMKLSLNHSQPIVPDRLITHIRQQDLQIQRRHKSTAAQAVCHLADYPGLRVDHGFKSGRTPDISCT